ncbi:MAG: 23S rRNA (guanosine(2251)-2'-O)-methyltransferase RlmB [Armatimonadota bacterium]|nr:23S rRNA (guanosine(2251)-2'-O)-methyltransferase RlmB [Armatimonadota bacterium]MDR7401322.1 23S rRNA (guanosine(2251)-2'-O)-methyltransferase RlmB [Armatimonadota bacterium]MDR7437499.1 23S rRNA (guanosine(2251)-2'-O)-methyltransferase RlmB [Armatimonadota bacterium]MDR7472336.1 23S rRNA (guanosine(2251)-2'-O)-methyltransferase RlmB [Armatimonadota bacterium]MDR7506361.1 23S rRNA (guanosine(2251)-2'-O)-methyltransferase RlmB [Armatimonadota bacterium]
MDHPGPDVRPETVVGRRPVLEALRSGRPLHRILLSLSAHGPVVRDIVHQARSRGVVVQTVDERRLRQLAGALPHQGVVALVAARPPATVDQILARARERNEPPLVVVLDGVQDPLNLGAIIRTAEGAGAHGVIIPRRRAAGLTPAVARASAGALEYLPVAQVTNLVRCLSDLKAAGLWVVGADPQASDLYHQARLVPPLALVLGGEERGISRLVREHCDQLVRLPMRGRVQSLNVSAAAAVLLYEVVRQASLTRPAREGRAAASGRQARAPFP